MYWYEGRSYGTIIKGKNVIKMSNYFSHNRTKPSRTRPVSLLCLIILIRFILPKIVKLEIPILKISEFIGDIFFLDTLSFSKYLNIFEAFIYLHF